MPNYNSTLQTNNSSLQEIITQLNNMPDAEDNLDTSDATATVDDILYGKTAYVNGEKITGVITTKTQSDLVSVGAIVTVPSGYYSTQVGKAVATATQATPIVSVSSSGLITATSTQSAGYVSAGTKSGTKQMTTKAATTYTPSTSNQTIASGTYLTGTQTIVGDANLIAENIKSGTSIFGVTGSYEGGNVSGEGATIETYTGTLSASGMMPPLSPYGTLWYTDASLTTQNVEISSFPHSFTVVKNSIIYWKDQADVSFKGGTNITKIYSTSMGTANAHAAIVPTADNFDIQLGM